jgi:PAS domain S-box-containing protein
MTLAAVPSLLPSSGRPARDASELRVLEVLRGGAASNPSLTMVLQPVVDLRSGRIIGAEALARFKGEPYRTPDLWFEDARRTGLGTPLELLAIEIALSRLPDMPPGTYLAVNASPETLVSQELCDLIARFPAERIVIELTEHARVDDYAALQEAVAWFRARGARLAVDDAGAGFASFQHILRLQPNIIKLDRSLTSGVDANPVRHALASAMVTFAATLGAKICAEGIETAAEIACLQQLGIACGQGYFLGKPGPLPLPEPPAGVWFRQAPTEPPPSSTMSPVLRSPKRLAAVRATGLLDTEPEELFDRFTRLASRVLRAPIAAITLLDDRRQFFKSAIGVSDLRETPLAYSICASAVAMCSPLIIDDTRVHPLVKDKLAIQKFGVGAYAAIPIVTPDHQPIGALCVIDTSPHRWSDDDVATLSGLAEMIGAQIEMRRGHDDLERRAAVADALFEKSDLPIFVFDVDSRLERSSAAARALLGLSDADLEGVRSLDLVHRDDIVRIMHLRDKLLTGTTDRIHSVLRFRAFGNYPPRHIAASLVRDRVSGAAKLFVVTLGDIVADERG